MKKIFLILALITLIGLINCSEDFLSLKQEIFSSGSISASRNGLIWEGSAIIDESAVFPNVYSFNALRFNEQGFERESLGIAKIKNIRSRQEILSNSVRDEPDSLGVFYTTVLDDGDANGDFYVLVPETNNWFQITEVDERNSRIIGEFELHLMLAEDQGRLEPDAEPTIDFISGAFNILAPDNFFQ